LFSIFPIFSGIGSRENETAVTAAPGNDQIAIRGLALSGNHLDGERIDEIKKFSANYVQIIVWPQLLPDESIIVLDTSIPNEERMRPIAELLEDSKHTKERAVEDIVLAHKNGLKVYLVLYPEKIGGHEAYGQGLKDPEKYMRQIGDIAVDWAKLAQENKVELFSPLNEIFLFVGNEKAIQWYKDILPRVKAVYSGELAPRGLQFYDWDPLQGKPIERGLLDFDFTGWDYIASDFYCQHVDSFEHMKTCLLATINKSIELKDRYGAKGVFLGEISHLGGSNAKLESSESFNRDSYALLMKEGVGRIDGFFFWDWEGYSEEMKDNIKDYYKNGKEISSTPLAMPEYETVTDEGYAYLRNRICGILLEDHFDDDKNWNNKPAITNGVLNLEGDNLAIVDVPGSEDWTDYKVSGKVLIESGSGNVWFRLKDPSESTYLADIMPSVFFAFHKHKDNETTVLAEVHDTVMVNQWHTFELYAKDDSSGGRFAFYVDDKFIYGFTDPNQYSSGKVALGSNIPKIGSKTAKATFDDIKIEKLC
jgi:hypothetical protein